LAEALSDDKIRVSYDKVVTRLDCLDPCARRSLAPESGEEIGEDVFIPLYLDVTGSVADPSRVRSCAKR
jgi:hypothetical protein